jgi:uncharacterized protein YndB with AHSA1/START domain
MDVSAWKETIVTVNKNEYEVVRRATVEATPQVVFDLIVDFHRWSVWSPWEDIDPDLERTFSGPASGVGAVYEWSGNRKAGKGRMEITEADAPSRVVVALQFLKPFKSSNVTTFELAANGAGTDVTWRMVGPKTFMTKVMGIFTSMDKMIGPDFEKGLTRLAAAARG